MARSIIEHVPLAITTRGDGLRMDHVENERLRGIRARCGCESCVAHRAGVTQWKAISSGRHGRRVGAGWRLGVAMIPSIEFRVVDNATASITAIREP